MSTTILYRSVLTGHAWDQFEPIPPLWTSSHSPKAHYLLRARSPTLNTFSYDNHVMMGWAKTTCSPYISFTASLEWAIYHQLRYEYFNPDDRNGRHLYALEVVSEDVQNVYPLLTNARAKGNVVSAQEVLATLQVRVVRMVPLMDTIPEGLRDTSQQWFAKRSTWKRKRYPFREWKKKVTRLHADDFGAMENALSVWQGGK
ncbi:hypothetical protein BCR44DRAFT_1428621 [Catenaria anguillulae PL171]|uniref:Uncharacterized protein n=1 Tax=Catenaria anguillulae PL171 TaxID=765915 RepID=A0A1Y2HVI6_9FUNG|nr:hypothetical protein BCR44DRAFT_1428621 [Catenaria anguillulae PL171]